MRARRVAAIAGAVYLATLVVVPLIDRETDVVRAHPVASAIAVVVFRGATRLQLIAAGLLVPAAVMSAVLAMVPQEVTRGPLLIGVLALALAPLLVSLGGVARLSPVVVRLGVIVTAGFVPLVVLAPHDVAGIANRAWDVLLASWGLLFAIAPRPVREVEQRVGAT